MDVLTDEVKEFQLKLEAILKEFLEQGSIEVYGNLKMVVADIFIVRRKGSVVDGGEVG
jgi:hypothetical protein